MQNKKTESQKKALKEKKEIAKKTKTAEKTSKEAKEAKQEASIAESKTKKKEKPKRELKKKPKELLKLQRKLRAKKHVMFRGRFGKRRIRRISNKKWQRWRLPRGIDIEFKVADGARPKIGYSFAKEIRHMHPSGCFERYISTVNELENISKDKKQFVIRVNSNVGRKKKIEIAKKAQELGLRVLNVKI